MPAVSSLCPQSPGSDQWLADTASTSSLYFLSRPDLPLLPYFPHFLHSPLEKGLLGPVGLSHFSGATSELSAPSQHFAYLPITGPCQPPVSICSRP